MTLQGNPEPDKDPRTFAIIGAAMEVHRELGSGFLEAVYQEALALELKRAGVPFEREPEIPVQYKGRRLDIRYRPDFICFDNIVIELKAIKTITPVEEAQAINYLKATRYPVALLLNFGSVSLQQRRYANTALRRLQNPQSAKSA